MLGFFLQYTNEIQSSLYSRLRDENGNNGIVALMVIRSLCVQNLIKPRDRILVENDFYFELPLAAVANISGMKSKSIENILGTLQECNELFWERSGNVLIIKYPKLLELLSSEHRRARYKPGTDPVQARLDRIGKDRIGQDRIGISGEAGKRKRDAQAKDVQQQDNALDDKSSPAVQIFPEAFSEIDSLLKKRKVTRAQLDAWMLASANDANWICQEIKKAFAWEASNPKNAKKDFPRFMQNWLNRAWDLRTRPSSNTNYASKISEGNRAAMEEYYSKFGKESK